MFTGLQIVIQISYYQKCMFFKLKLIRLEERMLGKVNFTGL